MAAASELGGCTEAAAPGRAARLDVESYAVFLDIAADPDQVRSRAGIRFRCREPGAATFADLRARSVTRVTRHGQRRDPGRASRRVSRDFS